MPRPGGAIQVDQRKPSLPDDREVVARDRLAPPRFLDAPSIADLRIETAFRGTAKGSAVPVTVGHALDVDPRIVNELARLASQNDSSIGRNAEGPGVLLTNAEKEWMRAATILIARQIGAANAGAEPYAKDDG